MGMIDATTFVDTAGVRYLVWKADGNAVGQPTPIYGQQLSADGKTLAGTPAGTTTLVYHAWDSGHTGRYMLVDPSSGATAGPRCPRRRPPRRGPCRSRRFTGRTLSREERASRHTWDWPLHVQTQTNPRQKILNDLFASNYFTIIFRPAIQRVPLSPGAR